jgi:hypothetical protein
MDRRAAMLTAGWARAAATVLGCAVILAVPAVRRLPAHPEPGEAEVGDLVPAAVG